MPNTGTNLEQNRQDGAVVELIHQCAVPSRTVNSVIKREKRDGRKRARPHQESKNLRGLGFFAHHVGRTPGDRSQQHQDQPGLRYRPVNDGDDAQQTTQGETEIKRSLGARIA